MIVKRRILVGLATVHFLIIILHNISSTADGFQHVYGGDMQIKHKRSVLDIIQNINQLSPILEYAYFSGTEAGFGFFAPQVGSQYISNFKAFDADGRLLNETVAPGIKQQESLLRYSSFLDLFQDMFRAERKIEQDPNLNDSLTIRYSRAIVYAMAERILANTPQATKVEAQIILYSHPNLKDYEKKHQARYLSVYQQTIEPKPGL